MESIGSVWLPFASVEEEIVLVNFVASSGSMFSLQALSLQIRLCSASFVLPRAWHVADAASAPADPTWISAVIRVQSHNPRDCFVSRVGQAHRADVPQLGSVVTQGDICTLRLESPVDCNFLNLQLKFNQIFIWYL